MRKFLILAVAASFAVACAGRTEDDMGAAPDQGDTTVTAVDTSTTVQTDTTMGQVPADTSFVEQDTTFADPGMGADTTSFEPGVGVDSIGAQGEVQTGDTTWTDTTSAETSDTVADTTDQPY